MLTAGPKGTNDILPGEIEKWHYIEQHIRNICTQYGFSEIRTPIFEHTELFKRGVGDTTDVVEKEMYTFQDKGGRDVSLRPEQTACVARAYVEHKLYAQPQPVKVFYIGPMFRYANVQAGRYRQFHQFGIEVLGSKDPVVDAEVITMAMDFYGRLGLRDLELHINSVGCPQCRPLHRQKLHDFLAGNVDKLCKQCQSRFSRNPMRILDCKESECQDVSHGAPTTTDCLCDECADHFAKVKKFLDQAGIKYIVNNRLVRGLDYYTNTAFEIMASDIGAQSSIGGGGRYDGLIEQVGAPQPTPGIGFALGIERIIATMERQNIEFPGPLKYDVFIAALGEPARETAFKLLYNIRAAGLTADMDVMGRGLKAQMKYANKFATRFALILGDEELSKGVAVIRDMKAAAQEEVPLEKVLEYLRNGQ
ncbi:MAG: histidine--tRNA ligase [Thermincola sp.]|jgi:histidyl-tRNA synthetase|nr:histidine--tRNA ligase [Thermincola sp.]MDT3702645.1 histidine--tRNA ligase [Thermincola sp.]